MKSPKLSVSYNLPEEKDQMETSLGGAWVRLQHLAGNYATSQLVKSMHALASSQVPGTLVQGIFLSYADLIHEGKGKTPDELFHMITHVGKYVKAAQDPVAASGMSLALQVLLKNENDRWVAQKLLEGKLGMSEEIHTESAGESCRAKIRKRLISISSRSQLRCTTFKERVKSEP